MDEPSESSPLGAHLQMQMQPTRLQSAPGAVGLAESPCYPPNANVRPPAVGTVPCGLERPPQGQQCQGRELLTPALYQRGAQENKNAFNVSLKVDCNLFSPRGNANTGTQPITPSPNAPILHDNNRGWHAPPQRTPINDGVFTTSTGRRIGYDGTNQTPSFQLLRPTASSLGHRVQRSAHSPTPPSTAGFHVNADLDLPRNDGNAEGQRKVLTFSANGAPAGDMTVAAAPLDPFGKLSEHGMDDKEQNGSSSDLQRELLDYGMESTTDEGRLSPRASGMRPALHRSTSWSPESNHLQQQMSNWHAGLDDIRNIDPVASQLLRECEMHDEEPDGTQGSNMCHASNVGDVSPYQSPRPGRSYSDSYCAVSPSTSMPNLFSLSPTKPSSKKRDRCGRRVAPIAEEKSFDYPKSPVPPIFGDASSNMLDVNSAAGIQSLARPVPVRRTTLPPSFDVSPTFT